MKALDRQKILSELEWHVEDPPAALELLTQEEIRQTLRRGYLTQDLAEGLAERLTAKTVD